MGESLRFDHDATDLKTGLSADGFIVLGSREPALIGGSQIVRVGHHFADAGVILTSVPRQPDTTRRLIRHSRCPYINQPSSPRVLRGLDAACFFSSADRT